MTFDFIVQEIAADLNLTSTDAILRIGRHVNRRYKELLALPWLQISRRGEITQPVSIGIRYVTFPVTKLYSVFDPTRPGETLGEVTFDELRNSVASSDPPNLYAIARATNASISIFLDCIPASVYNLMADAELKTVILSGKMEPKFNEDFHDILIYWGKALELLKMEKDLAKEAEDFGAKRLSDLKFHIAKTGYVDYVQGKNAQGPPMMNTTIT